MPQNHCVLPAPYKELSNRLNLFFLSDFVKSEIDSAKLKHDIDILIASIHANNIIQNVESTSSFLFKSFGV